MSFSLQKSSTSNSNPSVSDQEPVCDLPFLWMRDFEETPDSLFSDMEEKLQILGPAKLSGSLVEKLRQVYFTPLHQLYGHEQLADLKIVEKRLNEIAEQHFKSSKAADLDALFGQAIKLMKQYIASKDCEEVKVDVGVLDGVNKAADAYAATQGTGIKAFLEKIAQEKAKTVEKIRELTTNIEGICNCRGFLGVWGLGYEVPTALSNVLESGIEEAHEDELSTRLAIVIYLHFQSGEGSAKALEFVNLIGEYYSYIFINGEYHSIKAKFFKDTMIKTYNLLVENSHKDTAAKMSIAFMTYFAQNGFGRRVRDEVWQTYSQVLLEDHSHIVSLADKSGSEYKAKLVLLLEILASQITVNQEKLNESAECLNDIFSIEPSVAENWLTCIGIHSARPYKFHQEIDRKLAIESHDFFVSALFLPNLNPAADLMGIAFDQEIDRRQMSSDLKYFLKFVLGSSLFAIKSANPYIVHFPLDVSSSLVERMDNDWKYKDRFHILKLETKNGIAIPHFSELFQSNVHMQDAAGQEKRAEEKVVQKKFKAEVTGETEDLEYKEHMLDHTTHVLHPNCQITSVTEAVRVPVYTTSLPAKFESRLQDKVTKLESMEILTKLAEECKRERYDVKENIIKLVRGGISEEKLNVIRRSPDMLEYVRNNGVLSEEIDGVEHEYVFVQVRRKDSPCYNEML